MRITVDVRGPRSLQFGVGASFGGRDLFALSSNDGTMRGLAVGVRGAPTVVPAP